MERLEILQPLAAADKRDRHADDADHRQRRAAARIAVHLAQDDAGHADPPVELAGALDRVLPGHRVGDVQQVGRLHRRLDRLELVHQLVVDVQAAGGVDDHDVEAAVLRLGQRAGRAPHRIQIARRVEGLHARLLRHDRQLLDRRRAPDVGRHQQRMPALLRQPPSELADVVVLPEPCRPSSRMTRGRCADGGSPPVVSPNSASISSRTMRTTCWSGVRLFRTVLVDGAIAHPVDERLDDLEVDVRLEQRHADFPQRHFDRLLA